MLIAVIIAALVLFGVIAFRTGLFARLSGRRARVADLLAGKNLLAAWTYDPDEWRQAVADEFTWVRNKSGTGQCYISPTEILIKNGSEERLIDLSARGKVVTHASYLGAEGSPLKIRVRWREVRRYEDRTDEEKYHKEDLRIPVPFQNRADATRVAAFFTAQAEQNLAAYTSVVSDDEPISLFGKDSF